MKTTPYNFQKNRIERRDEAAPTIINNNIIENTRQDVDDLGAPASFLFLSFLSFPLPGAHIEDLIEKKWAPEGNERRKRKIM